MELLGEERHDPRTIWEAEMDAKYAVAAHALCERGYARMNAMLVFLQALFTSGAVAAIARQSVFWSMSIGALLAVVSGSQQSVKPLAQSARHGAAKERFQLLVAKAPMALAKWDSELSSIRVKVPLIPRSIQTIAYNDNLRTNGRPGGMLVETRWQRLVRKLA